MADYKCPYCGADLDDQDDFYDDNLYHTCTECGEDLTRDEWLDEVPCPNCGTNLWKQSSYDDYNQDYTCESCGTYLHHDYSGAEWKVAPACPSCGANLKKQYGYNEDYDDDYQCTECNAHLHRGYGEDEYKVVVPCPYCGTNLKDQDSYDDLDTDWDVDYTCEECGTKLHRDYDWSYWEVVEDDDDDDDDESTTYTSYSSSSTSYSSDYDSIKSFKKVSSTRSSKPKSYISSDYSYGSGRKSSLKKTYRIDDSEPAWKVILAVVVCFLLIAIPFIGEYIDNGGFNSDPNAIPVGVSSGDLEGEHYKDVVEIFEKNGFTNIVVREGNWNLFKKSGTVKSISIDGKEYFRSYSKFPKDVLIVIVYYK